MFFSFLADLGRTLATTAVAVFCDMFIQLKSNTLDAKDKTMFCESKYSL